MGPLFSLRSAAGIVLLLPALAAPPVSAQSAGSADGVPVHMTVTVEGKHDNTPGALAPEDVMVWQDKQRRRVTDWAPCSGDRAGLQFWLLIDDSANSNIGSQFEDVRRFIAALPGSTQIGVGYMRNGTVEVVQPLTSEHAQAAKSLRLPIGVGSSASPYLSLTDLVKKWPAGAGRREVLMMTSGIDLYYGPGPEDPYLLHAIDVAQRAGVIVDSIYYSSFGHLGHNNWQINWGQSDLAQLGDATGGEAYWQGFGNPVSLAPFLDDLKERLSNQYELTFLAQPGKKAELQQVRLSTEVPRVSLVAARRVWVPAP